MPVATKRFVLRMIPCIIMVLGGTVFGDDAFYVFAPDQKNEQVLSLEVHATGHDVTVRMGDPLRLSFGPTSITGHRDGKVLIVSSATPGDQEKAAAVNLEVLEAGKLRVVETSPLIHPTGYTSIDRSGRYFLSTNYRSGSIDVYRIDQSGAVGVQVCSRKTPQAYAHSILTTRDNRFAYVPCVKENNALYQFTFDEQNGQLIPLDPFDASPPAMFGPRHVAYHPTLPIVYFSNEQQLGVSVYKIGADGQLAATQHAVSMPRRSPYVSGKRGLHGSDLVMTPDGQRLFLAVRDFVADEDSVFAFQVESDGRLRLIGRTKVGDVPWKLALSPNGRFLLVSESFDRRLSILAIHSDGSLSPAAHVEWDAEVRDMVVVDSR